MTAPGKSWTRGFTYDNAGNMDTRMSDAGNQQTLDWDTEGRLDKVTEAGKDTSFIYDADGKRLIRKDTTKRVLYLPGGTEVSRRHQRHRRQGNPVLHPQRHHDRDPHRPRACTGSSATTTAPPKSPSKPAAT